MLLLVKTELEISAGCQSDQDDDVLSRKHKILQQQQIHVSWLNIIGLNNNHVIQVSTCYNKIFCFGREGETGVENKRKNIFSVRFRTIGY